METAIGIISLIILILIVRYPKETITLIILFVVLCFAGAIVLGVIWGLVKTFYPLSIIVIAAILWLIIPRLVGFISKGVFPSSLYTPPSMAEIDQMEGTQFESFCADLLCNLDYQNVKLTKATGDQGVDIVATKDSVKYAFQCKRYSGRLGNKPVQEVFAGLSVYGCQAGVVITNSYFTNGAVELATKNRIKLIDRNGLVHMVNMAVKQSKKEVRKTAKEESKSKKKSPTKDFGTHYVKEAIEEGSLYTEVYHVPAQDDEEETYFKKRWPHCDAREIDSNYFLELPHIGRCPGMRDYVKMYPVEPSTSPLELDVDQIITIKSEEFESEIEAAHFAKAIQRHSAAISRVETAGQGTYIVLARTHVYSVRSNYRDHGHDGHPHYLFANWA